MSRIGVKPITVPAGVEVTIAADNTVTVKGPKGTLTKQFDGALTIKQEENVITSRESCFAQPVIKNVINNTKNNFLA